MQGVKMKNVLLLALGASLLMGSVDINSADKESLMGLNGIGEAKAQSIINYRETKCITNAKELQEVKGIGEAIIAKNKDEITFGACKK